MSDIPSSAFSDQGPINPYERPKKDAYCNIVTDDERQQLLNLPTPILAEAVAETVKLADRESQQSILQRITTMGMRGEKLSPIVNELLDYTQGKIKPVPFLGGANYEYLSVFCGFIAGVRTVKDNRDETEAGQILENLKINTEKMASGNPQQNELVNAANLIKVKVLQ